MLISLKLHSLKKYIINTGVSHLNIYAVFLIQYCIVLFSVLYVWIFSQPVPNPDFWDTDRKLIFVIFICLIGIQYDRPLDVHSDLPKWLWNFNGFTSSSWKFFTTLSFTTSFVTRTTLKFNKLEYIHSNLQEYATNNILNGFYRKPSMIPLCQPKLTTQSCCFNKFTNKI